MLCGKKVPEKKKAQPESRGQKSQIEESAERYNATICYVEMCYVEMCYVEMCYVEMCRGGGSGTI